MAIFQGIMGRAGSIGSQGERGAIGSDGMTGYQGDNGEKVLKRLNLLDSVFVAAINDMHHLYQLINDSSINRSIPIRKNSVRNI